MKKIAICIDDWKRETFEKGISEGGFSFETLPFTKDGTTFVIRVEIKDNEFNSIQNLVFRLEEECRTEKSRLLPQFLKSLSKRKKR